MKFEGKVTYRGCRGRSYRGWERLRIRGSVKEIELTLSNESSSAKFNNVSAADLSNLIEELEKIKKELENAPMKNAWAELSANRIPVGYNIDKEGEQTPSREKEIKMLKFNAEISFFLKNGYGKGAIISFNVPYSDRHDQDAINSIARAKMKAKYNKPYHYASIREIYNVDHFAD